MIICSVVYDRPDTVPAGVELTLWKLSRQLTELGCDVHILFDEKSGTAGLEATVDGIHFHGVGSHPSDPLSHKVVFARNGGQRLRQIQKAFNPDVFAFHGPGSLPPLLDFRRKSARPFVYHTYAALPFEARTHLAGMSRTSLSAFFGKSLMYAFYSPLEFFSLRRIQKLVLPMDRAAEEFRTCYACPHGLIGIVPLGQDLYERYGNRGQEVSTEAMYGKRILLFVGNDWHRKGVWSLLLAFRAVLNRIPNVILIITGPPQEPFVSLARDLDLADSVIFPGNVDERTLAGLYEACDIFVLPSFHEGFSNTVIEAMAFSKPVIVTRIAGYPVVTHGKEGLLVNAADCGSISSSIERLLGDRELYEEMSRNAAAKAKEYTWRNAAIKLLKIYDTIKS